MKNFQLINLGTWPRREYFQHYYSTIPCTYSMTVNFDITDISRQKHKLYPVLLHAISTAVNNHEEFRTTFDEQGRLGVYNIMHPCYTIFHKDTETFSNLWTAYTEDLDSFCAAYEKDLTQYGSMQQMHPQPDIPANVFPVSMVPWESFTAFNLNLPKGSTYLLPIFTIGRYFEQDGRLLLPVAIQVHHAVCDGFHVCRLIDEVKAALQKY